MTLRFLTKAGIKKLFFLFVFFSCLFSVKYSFPPYHSLVVCGGIGMISYILAHYTGRRALLQLDFFEIATFYFLLLICAIISTIVNGIFDIHFFIEIILINIFRFFSAYLLVKMFFRTYGKSATLDLFVLIWSMLTVFQIIISILMFFDKNVFTVITNITAISDLEAMKMEGALGVRMFGIGGYAFYGAGISNIIILILISFVLAYVELSQKRKLLLLLCYLIICFLGPILSRTTIIGVFFSLLLLFANKQGRRILLYVCLGVFGGFGVVSLMNFSNDFLQQATHLMNFGYEMILNYANNGSMETKSTDVMINMYRFPDNFSTWLIGDAQLRGADGGYYMKTDIGFLRLIYYFGLIGLLVFYAYQIRILYFSCKLFKEATCKLFFIFVFLVIILNLKGLTDLSFYFFLFYHFANNIYGKSINQCNYTCLQC